MQRFILAIDQGTTGTTALVFDEHLHIHTSHTIEFKQHFPQPSWVEHDLDEIWASVVKAVRTTLEKGNIDPKAIVAIGITNQRETTCLWQKNREATPLGRAIVWQDRRTAAECEKFKKQGL